MGRDAEGGEADNGFDVDTDNERVRIRIEKHLITKASDQVGRSGSKNAGDGRITKRQFTDIEWCSWKEEE